MAITRLFKISNRAKFGHPREEPRSSHAGVTQLKYLAIQKWES
jgi:hypothetical protein